MHCVKNASSSINLSVSSAFRMQWYGPQGKLKETEQGRKNYLLEKRSLTSRCSGQSRKPVNRSHRNRTNRNVCLLYLPAFFPVIFKYMHPIYLRCMMLSYVINNSTCTTVRLETCFTCCAEQNEENDS